MRLDFLDQRQKRIGREADGDDAEEDQARHRAALTLGPEDDCESGGEEERERENLLLIRIKRKTRKGF